MLESALSYARRGWKVVPLHNPTSVPTPEKGGCSCGKSDCESQGKHPRWHQKDLANGLLNATDDESIIRNWWKRWPKANIALVTGAASGVVVLDVDAQAGWDYLEQNEIYLPRTRQAVTSPGKAHIYFTHPGVEVRNFAKKIPGMDFRGDGGYVVAPPSLHRTGSTYKWNDVEEIADCPAWLLNFFKKGELPSVGLDAAGNLTGEVQISDADLLPPIEEKSTTSLLATKGDRNIVAARQAGIYFARGLGEEEVACLMERWNVVMCSPPLSSRELNGVIKSIGQAERRKRLFVQASAQEPLPPAEATARVESEEDRTYLHESICKAIGAPFSIREINRVIGEETKWRFDTSAGKIEMTTAELLSFKTFQVKVANRTGHCSVKNKKTIWEKVCQGIMDVATDIDPGPEATTAGLLTSLMKVYLDKHAPTDEYRDGTHTFYFKEKVGFFLTKFQNDLKMVHGVTLDPKSLAQAFTGLGITNCVAKLQGKTRRFWVLPSHFVWKESD